MLTSLLVQAQSGWSSIRKPVAKSPAFADSMAQITVKILSVQKLLFQVVARRATLTGVNLKGKVKKLA